MAGPRDGDCSEDPASMPVEEALRQMPDLLGDLAPEMPGMPSVVFNSLARQLMGSVHRNFQMSGADKDAQLRQTTLPIPGEPAGRSVKLLEDPKGVYSACATGSIVWPAATVLIARLDGEVPSAPVGGDRLRVLDLGAGLGPVGLFLALHKAKSCEVVLTEVPEAMALLARNVAENFPEGGPEVLPLRWGDVGQQLSLSCGGAFDFIVGSDITYRPEWHDELLSCCAALLKPDGRVLLSLQDRTGEASTFEQALARSSFRIRSRDDTVVSGVGAINGSALDDLDGDAENNVTVILYELHQESQLTVNAASAPDASCFFMQSPSEVEAEFERMTGIKPDRLFSDGYPQRPVPPKALPSKDVSRNAPSMRDKLVDQFLERGLGDYLCDIDEVLKRRLAKEPPGTVRTERQRRAFAEAYFAGVRSGATQEEECSTALVMEEPASRDRPELRADVERLLQLEAAEQAEDAKALRKAAEPSTEEERSPDDRCCLPSSNAGASSRVCLEGLEWSVELSEADAQLSATISFREELWQSLQGAEVLAGACSASSASFRDVVGFEMAGDTLRVTHAGATVLELALPQAVDPDLAVAKICGRRRRVTVRAPLRAKI